MDVLTGFLVVIFIVVIVGAVGGFLEQKQRENLSIDKILQQVRNMDSRQFEFFCAKLFELQGYKTKVTRATGDGGKDIIMWKGNNKYYVECKHFNQKGKVSRPIANKLYGSMCGDGVSKGFIITTGGYSKECREWCSKTGIRTMECNDLAREIQKIGLEQVASAIKKL